MIPQQYVGVPPGNWISLYDDGQFEAGETFDVDNVVAIGCCQPIPD